MGATAHITIGALVPVLVFIGSTRGRWARATAGAALIIVGIVFGGWWALLAALGLVFLAVGILDFCLLAPLVGRPVRGPAFRASFSS
ncbi:DUF2892 domain-containing protein [Cryobacterium sp. CG_9.6]|uniref:DUF2892 domain-containing protein n=1 Tax=Cryobacterium sp. CG_9.6 TaxID=2760710 RepID=UPI0024762BFC|nr:DUF2892 domain-containing protein [Cryobacterium sp. CG_9.6]MDH6238187.1 putative phage tail protein [Cryobacterium sp. CG_9.6]